MNYRHAFHAGNFADVLKHVVLALCIDRLNAKDKPWRYIDTHAGVGRYDLTGDEAMRSPEWRDGVARVWCAMDGPPKPPDEVAAVLTPYMDVLRAFNPDGRLVAYPGSPAIAAQMMRPGDALRLCELHPESAERLRLAMSGDRRVKIEERDGFEALAAFLPPPERRGIVLVDPPFEEGGAERKLDFERMLKAARQALKRWEGGTYIFWRPIKDVDAVAQFDGDLASYAIEDVGLPPEKLLVVDLWVREIGAGPLSGAGVVVINPPFGLRERLEIAMPWLANLMDQTPDADDSTAGWRLESPSEEDDAA